MSYFKSILLGNLGGDASSRTTQAGDTAVTFSVVHNEGYGDKQTAVWVRCTYWIKPNASQKVVQFLKKGQQVLVEGGIRLNKYVKQNGEPEASLEMTVYSIQLCGGKSQGGDSQPAEEAGGTIKDRYTTTNTPASQAYAGGPSQGSMYVSPKATKPADDDDLPF